MEELALSFKQNLFDIHTKTGVGSAKLWVLMSAEAALVASTTRLSKYRGDNLCETGLQIDNLTLRRL